VGLMRRTAFHPIAFWRSYPGGEEGVARSLMFPMKIGDLSWVTQGKSKDAQTCKEEVDKREEGFRLEVPMHIGGKGEERNNRGRREKYAAGWSRKGSESAILKEGNLGKAI